MALGATLVASAARADDRAPPLVVMDADDPRVATGARAALAAAAERLGSTLVDLSPTPEPAPEAPAHLRAAIDAYHDFRYPDALASADRGLAEAAATGAAGLSPGDLSDLFIYRALALGEQGDAGRAWDDHVRAATIDPGRVLDAVRFPPRVVETFARAVAAVSAAPTSRFTADVPEGCAVWLDGREITGQRDLTTHAGEHYLRVRCAGREPYGAVILVSGEHHAVAPALRAVSAPSVAAVCALARERGFARVVWASASSAGRAPLVSLRLYDTARVALLGSAAVGLGGARAQAALAGALERIVAPPPTAPPPVAAAPARWYQRPWVWALAGVVVTSAVLLPFVFDSGAPDGFDVRPEGALPP